MRDNGAYAADGELGRGIHHMSVFNPKHVKQLHVRTR